MGCAAADPGLRTARFACGAQPWADIRSSRWDFWGKAQKLRRSALPKKFPLPRNDGPKSLDIGVRMVAIVLGERARVRGLKWEITRAVPLCPDPRLRRVQNDFLGKAEKIRRSGFA